MGELSRLLLLGLDAASPCEQLFGLASYYLKQTLIAFTQLLIKRFRPIAVHTIFILRLLFRTNISRYFP